MTDQTTIQRCPITIISFKGRVLSYARFNDGWEVKDLYTKEPIGCSPEILALVQEDQAKLKAKAARP